MGIRLEGKIQFKESGEPFRMTDGSVYQNVINGAVIPGTYAVEYNGTSDAKELPALEIISRAGGNSITAQTRKGNQLITSGPQVAGHNQRRGINLTKSNVLDNAIEIVLKQYFENK